AEGNEGTLLQGAVGLFAVDPMNRRAFSIRPPSGATFGRHAPRLRIVGSGCELTATAPRSPLDQAILLETTSAETHRITLVAQKWDEAMPRAQVLYDA